jgi:hypothetical protein
MISAVVEFALHNRFMVLSSSPFRMWWTCQVSGE